MPELLRASVLALLDTLSSSEKLPERVKGTSRPIWKPPEPTDFDEISSTDSTQKFIHGLQIPSVGNLKFPAMLLHNLGSPNEEEGIGERKKDIFGKSDIFLVNTSGSGKTRLLFEGLCDHWGLYFTSHLDSGLLGSADIQNTIVNRLDRRHGFVPFPFHLPQPQIANAALSNLQLARRQSSRALLARLLVFKLFLDCAMRLGLSRDASTKKQWLHFQLEPSLKNAVGDPTDDLTDVFLDVCETLADSEVNEAIMDEAISQTVRDILTALGDVTDDSPMYIVLDEANVASKKCWESFQDHHGYHSLLKTMLRTWREHLKGQPFVFVVAGTEVPQQHFLGDAEWDNFVWNSNTGYFMDSALQERYVSQFLPDAISLSIGKSLAPRIWRWMRGRHRFTAAYVAILLEHNFAKPQTYLDMVIHQGTGYFPRDLDYYVQPPSDVIPLERLNFTMIKRDKLLRSLVHLALMDLLLSSTNPGYSADAIKLVNEGIGRFTDSRCSHIAVDEPLIIARAVTWFSGDEGETPASILDYQYFLDHLVDPGMAPRHPPAYLAFALALAFGRSRRIWETFTLSRPVPKWSTRNSDIVVRRQDGDDVRENPLRDVDRIHRTLVTYSTTLADTLSWMRHHHRTAFCIHVTETTATLIFIVKLSNKTRFWATVRVLHSLADEEIATKIRDTADDLQAENLFREPDADSPPPDILDALDSLPNICSRVCPHGVLPIVAVLGKDVERDVLDGSRVALLRLDKLSQAMDLIPPEQVAERIINAVTRDPEQPEEEVEEEEEAEETTTRTKIHADATRASGSSQSRSKRARDPSIVHHDTRASRQSHATSSGTSRKSLRLQTQ